MHCAVLVVEDEPIIRMDTVDMLEGAGLTVVDFDDAGAAADYLTCHMADVAAVFTDVNLKGEMDGIELATFVAETAPGVTLLVTSGRYASRPDRLPSNVHFLQKPWLPREVMTVLHDAVAAHR